MLGNPIKFDIYTYTHFGFVAIFRQSVCASYEYVTFCGRVGICILIYVIENAKWNGHFFFFFEQKSDVIFDVGAVT